MTRWIGFVKCRYNKFMIFKQLRDNIKTLLEGIASIQEVSAVPTYDHTGYPAVSIMPAGNESDYMSNQDNKRVYLFRLVLSQNFSPDETSINQAYENIYDCIDDILNKIDTQDSPDSAREIAQNIGNGYTVISVKPTYGDVLRDVEKRLIFVDIYCRIYVSVDLTVVDE